MAKEVAGLIKLQIKGGAANPIWIMVCTSVNGGKKM